MLRDDVQADLGRRPRDRAAARVRRPHRRRVTAIGRRASSSRTASQGWQWEDRFYPLLVPGQRAHAPVPRRRRGHGRRPLRPALRRHDPGRVRRARARARDGRRRRVGRAAVPDVPALRRQPVPRGRRQGPRARDACARGTTGCSTSGARRTPTGSSRRRSIPLWDMPAAVARDRALRGEGLEGGALRREPVPDRAAVVPDRPLGPGVRGVRPTPACRCRCTSARRRGCSAVARDDAVGRHRAVRHQLDERARRPHLLRRVQRPTRTARSRCRKAARAGCRTCSSGSTTRGSAAATTACERSRLPSEVFAQHFWVCMVADRYAIRNRHLIGLDKLMWECDFPHNDSNWPDSRKVLADAVHDIPDDEARQIGELNARRAVPVPRLVTRACASPSSSRRTRPRTPGAGTTSSTWPAPRTWRGVDRLVVSDHVVFGEHLDAYAPARDRGRRGRAPADRARRPLARAADRPHRGRRRRRTGCGSAPTSCWPRCGARSCSPSRSRRSTCCRAGGSTSASASAGSARSTRRPAWTSAPVDDCSTTRSRCAGRCGATSERLRVVRAPSFDGIHAMPKPVQAGGVPIWVSGRCNPRVAASPRPVRTGWIPWGDDAADPRGEHPAHARRGRAARRRRDFARGARAAAPAAARRTRRSTSRPRWSACRPLVDAGVTDLLVHLAMPDSAAAAEDAFTALVDAFREAE